MRKKPMRNPMSRPRTNLTLMLDTGVLGKLVHPRPRPDILEWYQQLVAVKATILIPEIADYELRRELLRIRSTRALRRLEELEQEHTYTRITTQVLRHAAQLWAQARNQGTPTADPKELDVDMILAAQALEAGAIIATENVGHLSLFAEAMHWREIQAPMFTLTREEDIE
jgi:predicted nucleic acid-binding protein